MSKEFTFAIKSICFDEDYRPADNTRITTNFANLAAGSEPSGEPAQYAQDDRQPLQRPGALG